MSLHVLRESSCDEGRYPKRIREIILRESGKRQYREDEREIQEHQELSIDETEAKHESTCHSGEREARS